MSWKHATYACEAGCLHTVTLGRLPVALMIEHGATNFKVPSCIEPLVRIEPECTEAEIGAYVDEIHAAQARIAEQERVIAEIWADQERIILARHV